MRMLFGALGALGTIWLLYRLIGPYVTTSQGEIHGGFLLLLFLLACDALLLWNTWALWPELSRPRRIKALIMDSAFVVGIPLMIVIMALLLQAVNEFFAFFLPGMAFLAGYMYLMVYLDRVLPESNS